MEETYPAEEPYVVTCDPLPEIKRSPGNATFVCAGLVGGYVLTFGLACSALAGVAPHGGSAEEEEPA